MDYSDEYLYWDNTEAVTVTVQRPEPPGDAAVDVATARRGSPDFDAATFGGVQLVGGEVLWLIPVALLEGVELGPAAAITTSAGEKWIVATAVEVRVGSSRGYWQCLCRKSRT